MLGGERPYFQPKRFPWGLLGDERPKITEALSFQMLIANSGDVYSLFSKWKLLATSAGTISSYSIPQHCLWFRLFPTGVSACAFLFIVDILLYSVRAGVIKPDRRVSWPEQLQMSWKFSLRRLGKLHRVIPWESSKWNLSWNWNVFHGDSNVRKPAITRQWIF